MTPYDNNSVSPRNFLMFMKRKIWVFSFLPTIIVLALGLPAAGVAAWMFYNYTFDLEINRYKRFLEQPVRSIVLGRDASIIGEYTLQSFMNFSNIYAIKIVDTDGTVWVDLTSTSQPNISYSKSVSFEVTTLVNNFYNNPDFASTPKKSESPILLARVSLLIDVTELNLFYLKGIGAVLGAALLLAGITLLLTNRVTRSLRAVTGLTVESMVGLASGKFTYANTDAKDSSELAEAKRIVNVIGMMHDNYEKQSKESLAKAIVLRDQALGSRTDLERQKELMEKYNARILREIQPAISQAVSSLENLEYHLSGNSLLRKMVHSVIEHLAPLPPLCNAMSAIGQTAATRKSPFLTSASFAEIFSDVYDIARSNNLGVITDFPAELDAESLITDHLSILYFVSRLVNIFKDNNVSTISLTAAKFNPEILELTLGADTCSPLKPEIISQLASLSLHWKTLEVDQLVTAEHDSLSVALMIPRLPNMAFSPPIRPAIEYKVLMIDASPNNYPALSATLDSQNIHYRVVESYESALQLLSSNRFDAILLEPAKIGQNGFEIAKILQSRNLVGPSGLPTLIIGLVVKRTDDIEERAVASGMTFVMDKYHDLKSLGQVLAAMVDVYPSSKDKLALHKTNTQSPTDFP